MKHREKTQICIGLAIGWVLAAVVFGQNVSNSANVNVSSNSNVSINASNSANANIAVVKKTDVRELLPAQSFEREIVEGEKHIYKFDLQKDEFFQVRVEQKSVDVSLKLFDAAGKELGQMDGGYDWEILSFAAAEAGSFTLEIEVNYTNGKDYSIKRENSRTATDEDRKRVAVERVFMEGETAGYENLQIAKAKFTEALRGWQELKDEYLAGITKEKLGYVEEAIAAEERKIAATRTLAPGQTLEGEMTVESERHFYKFDLQKDEFFQVRVESKDIDVWLSLSDQSSLQEVWMDNLSKTETTETLTFVAGEAGNFTLTVSAEQIKTGKGHYVIRRENTRTATAQDRRRVEIEKIFVSGVSAMLDRYYDEAKAKFEESLIGWRELKDAFFIKQTTQLIKDLQGRVEKEKKLAQAYLLLEEGEKLYLEGTAVSKPEAMKKFREANRLFTELKESEGIAKTLGWLANVSEMQGKKLERQVKNTVELNLYRVNLKRGELFHVILQTNGEIGTTLGLRDESRNPLETSGYDNDKGTKSLTFITEKDGVFLLSVAVFSDKAQGGYVLEIDAPFINEDEKTEVAYGLHQLGNGNNESRNFELARLYHEQALKLWRELPQSVDLGLTLNWLGDDCYKLGEYDQALNYFQESAVIARKFNRFDFEESSLGGINNVYFKLKQFDKVLTYHQANLIRFRNEKEKTEDAATLNELRVKEANTLNYLGDTYEEMNQPLRAVEYFGQALALMREAKDRLREIWTLRRLGNLYSDIGQGEAALEHFEESLKISRELGNKNEEMRSLGGISSAYLDLALYLKSNETEEEKIKIAQTLGSKQDEAVSIGNIGLNYYYMGQYDKALEYCQKALVMHRENKSQSNEATLLNNIGVVYRNIGSYRKAVEYLTKALEIDQKIEKRDSESTALSNLGSAYAGLQLFDKAIESFEAALTLQRELQDSQGISATLTKYGTALRELNQLERATAMHKEALGVAVVIKGRQFEARALRELGFDFLAQKKPEIAGVYFERALAVFREMKDKYGEASTLKGLMEVWSIRGKKALATFYGKQAVNVLQSIRRDIVSLEDDVKADFIAGNESTYRKLAEILASQGRLGEAEQVADLLKKEEYFDYTGRDANDANTLAKDTSYTPDEEKQRVEYLEKAKKITELGRRVEELKLKRNSRTPQEDEELLLKQKDLDLAVKDFREFLKSLDGKFSDEKAKEDAEKQEQNREGFKTTVRDLGRITNQPGRVAAIYTIVGEKQLTLWVVTADNRFPAFVNVTAEELSQLVMEFRNAVRDKTVEPRPLGAKLYEKIFAPIDEIIKPLTLSADGTKEEVITLMWSLDGVLRYVPIAALYDENRKKYMVERFRNTVFTFGSNDKLKDKPDEKWSALGLGVMQKRFEGGKEFDPLKYVESELAIISDETKPDPKKPLFGKILRNEEFNLATMQTELVKERPVVHIASHFFFSPSNDDESFLVLGAGRWTITEIRKDEKQWFTGVQLLTLSACETAMGNGKEIDGFGSLAQLKGAQSVIATLWSVQDDSTSELMQMFYGIRSGRVGILKGEALRQAQLAIMYGKYTPSEAIGNRSGVFKSPGKNKQPDFKFDDNAPFAHPFFWSPFILIGNWL